MYSATNRNLMIYNIQMKKRLFYIDILKTIACVLIINTHSAPLFPDRFSYLSFGGDLGNDLFFMISGYCLYSFINNKHIVNFKKWYLQKVAKLFFISSVFNLINIIIRKEYNYGIVKLVKIFTIPNGYWFICAISILYIYIYIYGKIENNAIRLLVNGILLIAHLYFDTGLGSFSERYIMGAISMSAGYEIKKIDPNISKKISSIIIVISFVFFVILKMYCRNIFNVYFHLLQGVLIVIINSFSLMFASKLHIQSNIIIENISKSTLIAYLIGTKELTALFKYIVFPISYIINMVVILTVSVLLRKLYCKVMFIFQKNKNCRIEND